MNKSKEIDYTDHAYDMMYLIAEIQKGEAAALIRGKWSDKIDRDELIPVYRAVEFHDPTHDGRADDADQYTCYWVPEEVDSPHKVRLRNTVDPVTGEYDIKYSDEIIADAILWYIKEGRTNCEIGISVNVPENSPLYNTGYYDGLEPECEEWFSLDLLTGKHYSKTASGCGYGEYVG